MTKFHRLLFISCSVVAVVVAAAVCALSAHVEIREQLLRVILCFHLEIWGLTFKSSGFSGECFYPLNHLTWPK